MIMNYKCLFSNREINVFTFKVNSFQTIHLFTITLQTTEISQLEVKIFPQFPGTA